MHWYHVVPRLSSSPLAPFLSGAQVHAAVASSSVGAGAGAARAADRRMEAARMVEKRIVGKVEWVDPRRSVGSRRSVGLRRGVTEEDGVTEDEECRGGREASRGRGRRMQQRG